jgi:hypothetical protein
VKSLLFQPSPPLKEPPGCGPCRKEIKITYRHVSGRLVTMTLRDKVSVEDPYIMAIKAAAHAIMTVEPLAAQPVQRSLKDFLIKNSVTI